MPIELTAHTDAGDGSFPFEAIDAVKAANYFAAPVPVERIARDGVVLAAAISERGQDLTRPGTVATRRLAAG